MAHDDEVHDDEIEADVDGMLSLLREVIRRQGYTQLEVQAKLGWGRSYISQLLTKQKSLRVEQILMMLRGIGVEPGEFFGQLYGYGPPRLSQPARDRSLEPEHVAVVSVGDLVLGTV